MTPDPWGTAADAEAYALSLAWAGEAEAAGAFHASWCARDLSQWQQPRGFMGWDEFLAERREVPSKVRPFWLMALALYAAILLALGLAAHIGGRAL